MHNLVGTIIAQTFEGQVGRSNLQSALLVSFSTKIDYEKEDGYRYLDILIHAPGNYVGVYVRERSDVAALDADGEIAEDYTNTVGAWKCESYHDSGWRSALDQVLFAYRGKITGFAGGTWSQVVDVPQEIAENPRLGR